jgi:hypothetical protein
VRKPSAPASGRRERGGDAPSTSGCRNVRGRLRSRWLLLLLVALPAVLTAATTTQAATNLVGYFELGDEFEGSIANSSDSAKIKDADVNAGGTGGASPGDVYLLGHGIRQLSASDDFIRIWGTDVVKSGPDQAVETQAVRVDATGGTFRLSFIADTTGDLAANATAAQVESALNSLASIGPGGVSVTGGPGDAGGSSPYIVTFDGGSLTGSDQRQLKATKGSTPLSGAGVVNVYTINQGGSGFEVCEPAKGDDCQDQAEANSNRGRIAIDQASGDVYVTERNGIGKYSATGRFLRFWGRDVVAAGPDDSSVNEQKSVTVTADGGTFTLGFRAPGSSVQSTAPLPYDASAATVETALDKLDEIGGNYSSVSVSGGPGDLAGSSPYLITFRGLLGGDDLLGDGNSFEPDALVSNPNGLTISSGTKSVEVGTVTNGGGAEICKADDVCKEGSEKDGAGALSLRTYGSSLAVAPAGTSNAGDVIFGDDGHRNRVQEYSGEGAFVRAFGWDVDATDPSTNFEVCTSESGHVCKEGSSGSGVGQFANPNGATLSGVAEGPSGAIYTVENTGSFRYTGFGNRVQKFTPAGGLALLPSIIGSTEIQALTVNAGAGQFRLSFGIENENSTEGTGDFTPGSTTVTNVNTTKGEFEVGLPIEEENSGYQTVIPGGTLITAVGPTTLTLSNPARPGVSGEPAFIGTKLHSKRFYKTSDIPFNASSTEVESALNSLPSINAEGGSVSVTGGAGDASGSSPYLITFDGGPLARSDPAQLIASDGTTPLSGGSGASANTASVVTTTPGGPGGPPGVGKEREEYSSSPFDIAVGPGDRVDVAKYFPQAFGPCANGLPSPSEIRIEELNSNGTVLGTSDPCTGLTAFAEAFGHVSTLTVNPITGHPYLLNQNTPLEPRLNIFGPVGPAPSLTLDPVSGIGATSGTVSGAINPNGPGTNYPDTTGTPRVPKTTYRVEFKKPSDAVWNAYTPDIPFGSGPDAVPFSIGVTGLRPKTEYDLRVVVKKPFTATVEEEESFTTLPGKPEVEAFSSSDVTVDSAELHALVNPQGTATSYHFEYGTTPAYGSDTPEVDIGESHEGEPVHEHIEGLQDAVYHFRVIATNTSGTTTSADQTFTFHPPVCPNQTVRQQTGAAYLPDCRAYELVSPEDAGGTTLYTGGPQSPYASNPPRLAFVGQLAAIPDSGRNPIDTAGDLYISTRGAEGWRTRYIGPSSEEAGCAGGRPITSGTGPPSKIQNDVMADPSLSRIIDWNLGNPPECAFGWFGNLRFPDSNTAALGSNAPYLWNSHGDFLDRWPTSIADVPGGEESLSCPQDPSIHPFPAKYFGNIPVSYFCSTYVDASKDLNHFVFSTQSGLYGEGGLSAAPGSAYDNDTANNTMQLISKLPGGGPIGQEPGAKAGPEELIRFPSVSANGSHILMGTATRPACKHADFPHGGSLADSLCPLVTQPTHLYMRVNDAVTYDVSAGKPVHYVGATPDGTKVYFTSDEQLTGDDTDTSTDLYMWSENGGSPQLTRISKDEGGSAGNTDGCASTWTTKCDVKTYEDSKITAAGGNQGGAGSWTVESANPGYTDNAIAAKSGDIYFYSPEQLVAGQGAPGKENLYVYREGSVRLVAELDDKPYCLQPTFGTEPTCSSGAAGRLQVTPNGDFAAFVTTTSVTSYDSHGFAEMYRYNAETETVICVSCRPDGSPPTADVMGSQGGRFLTDDGRVFFNTTEPLEKRDSNAGTDSFSGKPSGRDVYEFTDGRPQLITTGTGTDRSSSPQPGLYGVSADGADVYFGTFDTLVGQDRNGAQLKFYDARTNGGFPFVPPPAPCAAADECHGAATATPPSLAGGTAAALGAGGNAGKAQKKKRHKKKQLKHKRGAQRAAQHKKGGAR